MTRNEDGEEKECTTLVLVVPPCHIMDIGFLELPDGLDIEDVVIDSDIKDVFKHEDPDKFGMAQIDLGHTRTPIFPMGDANRAACLQMSGTRIPSHWSARGSCAPKVLTAHSPTTSRGLTMPSIWRMLHSEDTVANLYEREERLIIFQYILSRLDVILKFICRCFVGVGCRCDVGTPVVAIGPGVVVEVQDSNTASGIHTANLYKWNLIALGLDNGSYVEYVHIKVL